MIQSPVSPLHYRDRYLAQLGIRILNSPRMGTMILATTRLKLLKIRLQQ